MNFRIDSLKKNSRWDKQYCNMQKKAKRGESNSLHSKLLNLHLSCRSHGKTHWSGNNLFPDEHILFQLLISQWKLGFYHLLQTFSRTAYHDIFFNGLDFGQLLTEQRTEYSLYKDSKIGFLRLWLTFHFSPSWVIGIAIETEYKKARRFLFCSFFFSSPFHYKKFCTQAYGIQDLIGFELYHKT